MGAVPLTPKPSTQLGCTVSRAAAQVYEPSWGLRPWERPCAEPRLWALLSGPHRAVPGAFGRLGRWGFQGLPVDELCIEAPLLQELFMSPHLRGRRRSRWSLSPLGVQSPKRAGSLSAT